MATLKWPLAKENRVKYFGSSVCTPLMETKCIYCICYVNCWQVSCQMIIRYTFYWNLQVYFFADAVPFIVLHKFISRCIILLYIKHSILFVFRIKIKCYSLCYYIMWHSNISTDSTVASVIINLFISL